MKDDGRGACLQFEIDRKRWKETEPVIVSKYGSGETPMERFYYMAQTAVKDTVRNGGTFVLVAGPDKLTMVQRPNAVDLEKP